MASCEKCWNDAYMRTFENPMKGQPEHYSDLIKEREKKSMHTRRTGGARG